MNPRMPTNDEPADLYTASDLQRGGDPPPTVAQFNMIWAALRYPAAADRLLAWISQLEFRSWYNRNVLAA